jgi:NADH dehydrogenase/NADH:ubiquinone oxidoreductase subunit G
MIIRRAMLICRALAAAAMVGALGVGPTATAQLAPLTARPDAPPELSRAQQLATTVLPLNEMLAVRVARFAAAYDLQLKDEARFIALEKQYPGISQAIAVVAREEATKAYREATELLQRDVAKIYGARFTDDELGKLLSFFSSQTGQAMITMSIASSGETASDFLADRRRKALAFLQNIDAQGKADLAAFMESGLQAKARAVGPEVSALSARRFADVDTIFKAALPARIDAVIARAKRTRKP